ncbi:hypothetical protein WICPIJ_006863 [Wickerhamomyces pijperi]|uniref:Rhodanese domain-containing protein n=1 Tax=Wickerhamomyces pijperi TaxID=599730 RepID=A0A9P8Q196_WICPI|nr:hypothetical protein WICPIJ_006863 [Wickerhamomyces pijperi]
MSSIAALKHLDHTTLRQWILTSKSPTGAGKFSIIDVRDIDHAGGHIINSIHFPYDRISFETILKLQSEISNSDDIVFHCALSQQRGPSSALRFLRTVDPEWLKDRNVWVLRGGFVNWQEHYGEDTALTEGYVKDIWKYGY